MTDSKKSLVWIVVLLVMIGVGVFGAVAVINKNKSGEEKKEEGKEISQEGGKKGGGSGGASENATGESDGGASRVVNLTNKELKENKAQAVAADFLEHTIKGESVSQHLEYFKTLKEDKLQEELSTDEAKLCFWINVYNGYTQYFLKKDPSEYKKDRNAYFSKDQIEILGMTINFNDIEHGVLRRGATIWSKGVVRIPFRNELVRNYKMGKVDYRIHFALNCGAKSCPPVCIYLPGKTSEQLDAASKYYLNKESKYDKKTDTIALPALMTWFSDDFGTRNDKRDILKKYNVIPENSDPKISYLDYDWTMKVENYKQF